VSSGSRSRNRNKECKVKGTFVIPILNPRAGELEIFSGRMFKESD
jgi:hypothetical protein